MNRILKRIATVLMTVMVVVTMSVMHTGTAYALSARIAFTDLSTEVGSEFSVNMKISSLDEKTLGSANIMLKYDPSYIEFIDGTNAEGGAGSIKVSGATEEGSTSYTYELKFKALQAGETTISVDTWEIYDADAKMASLDKQGSGKITIGGGAMSSANADLTALKISPGTLNPVFAADVTDYTAIVGGDVDKITISAPTSDPNAKVVITGNSGLQIGANTITCKVTASDGSTVKTYSIIVTKQEGTLEETSEAEGLSATGDKVTIGGIDYDIATSFDESLLPEGFELGAYSLNNKEVAAGRGIEKDILLLYLIAPDGSGDFYIYDEGSNLWSPYAEISVASKSVTIVPLDTGATLPEGFSETTLELNGKKVQGWIWASDTEQRYCIVYGMNWDGDKNFYRYDMTEKTIQRYFEDPAIDTGVSADQYKAAVDRADALQKEYDIRSIIMYALIALSAVLLIIIIILLIAHGRGRKYDTYDMDQDYEEVPVEVNDIIKKQNSTQEEMYLRGDEVESEEDIRLQEQTEKIKRESQDQLAEKMKADESLDNKDDKDNTEDDFETLDI